MMQCMAHPTRAAANTCSKCGNWLCDECTVEKNGRLMCRSCITAMEGHPAQTPREITEDAPARPAASAYKRSISGFLLLVFSVPPFPTGANYMYMGLIKRGLAAMCGLFLIIYLGIVSPFANLLIWLSLPVYVITCFFDGFNIRRKINAGEYVEDGVGDVINSVLNNKVLALIILGVIGVAFAGNILQFAVTLLNRAVPVLLVLLALYVIFRRKK